MRVEIFSCVENRDDTGLVTERVEDALHEIGAGAAFHMDGLGSGALGVGDHADRVSRAITEIGPKRLIHVVRAVVVDKNAYLVGTLVKIRNIRQAQHGDDLLHVNVGLPCRLSLVEPIDGEPDPSPDHGQTRESREDSFAISALD